MPEISKPLLLSFPEKMFVGIKNHKPRSKENPPLGFATPVGNDKAFEKRKESVLNWCGSRRVIENVMDGDDYAVDENGVYIREEVFVGSGNPFTFDNVPRSGFEFDKVMGRWETANKVFRITDPLGFQLEITAANLGDIILNGGIKHGRFEGQFIWGRHGSQNYLTRIDHPDYLSHLQPKIEREMQPGDVVYLGNKADEYLYCGAFYAYKTSSYERHDETKYIGAYAYRSNDGYYYVERVTDERELKPVHVYIKYDEVRAKDPYFHIYKSIGKHRILTTNNPLPSTFRVGEYGLSSPGRMTAFFNTKEEAAKFFPSLDEVIKAHEIKVGSYDYYGHKKNVRIQDDRKPPA